MWKSRARYNKSDYVPCIAWGRNAVFAGRLTVGSKIVLEGRIQSREYKKRLENGESETRRAFEVSILKLEEAERPADTEEKPAED